VGDDIPELITVPTTTQLFMFSAVTWNRHRIHYDPEFARSQGLRDVAIHRGLIGNLLARVLTRWLGDAGIVRQVEWTVRGSAEVGQPLRLAGKVRGKRSDGGRTLIDCDVWAEDHEGRVVAPGTAVVELRS
jgi:hydroxyacyl-ACP dehydratase HTD2-like protein with hotdog domain